MAHYGRESAEAYPSSSGSCFTEKVQLDKSVGLSSFELLKFLEKNYEHTQGPVDTPKLNSWHHWVGRK